MYVKVTLIFKVMDRREKTARLQIYVCAMQHKKYVSTRSLIASSLCKYNEKK